MDCFSCVCVHVCVCVADGEVTVLIQTKDVVGNGDDSPAVVAWTWDTTPPESAASWIVPCPDAALAQHEFDDGVVVIDAPTVCVSVTSEDGDGPASDFGYTVRLDTGGQLNGTASGSNAVVRVDFPGDAVVHNGTNVGTLEVLCVMYALELCSPLPRHTATSIFFC